MKSRRRPALRRNANKTKKLHDSKQEMTKKKDAVNKEDSVTATPSVRRKIDFAEVDVPDSESDESLPERIQRTSKRLDVIIAETDPSDDGIESADLFDEKKKERMIGPRRSPRASPIKRQTLLSSDESEYFDAVQVLEKSNSEKETSQMPSRSKDNKENDEDKNSQLYYLRTVLVPLEDIGRLMLLHSNGRLVKDSTCIRRNRTRVNRQSSISSNVSDISSSSDPNDEDFNPSESSKSYSDDSTSSSGSTLSLESDLESISSTNSWLPKRRISSSDDDSDSQSDELEETEDDFVLHTKRKGKDLRKNNYLLRPRAVRSKVAKYCNELPEESSDDDG